MSQVTVTLPRTGDTGDTVVVLEWLVAVGDQVSEGDPLVRVETAKVEVEIPATHTGTLVQQCVDIDDEVSFGEPLALIETT